MEGVVTRAQVLAHPIVIVEGFGLKVLIRSLFAGRGETFLDIVSRCAEEGARSGMDELDLVRTVRQFIGFERRARDLYADFSRSFVPIPAASKFFGTLSRQEEGHAIVLARVCNEVRWGRFWIDSEQLHLDSVASLDAMLSGFEYEAACGVSLGRALDIVERIETSELDVVFDSLNAGTDMRSRARFERFFAANQSHAVYWREQLPELRALVPRPAG